MLVGGDRFFLVHGLTLAPNQFSQLIKWREVKKLLREVRSELRPFLFCTQRDDHAAASRPKNTKISCNQNHIRPFLVESIRIT